MRTNEMIFWDEMNWENLLSFAAQFFGLVIVARWLGDTADEKVVLTVAATILYAAYLLLSIIKAKHNETAAQLEQTQIFYNEQIEETKKAAMAYENVNEKLTALTNENHELTRYSKSLKETLDDYKVLIGSSKEAVDGCKAELQNVKRERDENAKELQVVKQRFDELNRKYQIVKSHTDEISNDYQPSQELKAENKSLKTAMSRLIGEIKRYNPDYDYRGKLNLDN